MTDTRRVHNDIVLIGIANRHDKSTRLIWGGRNTRLHHVTSHQLTHHDGIPLLATWIASKDGDAFLLNEKHILTITDAIGKLDLVRFERVDLGQPLGAILIEKRNYVFAIVEEGDE